MKIDINPEKLTALQKERCEESFFNFVMLFWDVVIKETPVYNWHIPYLCEELQDLSYYIVNRLPKPYDLIINIPPGTSKSTICTVMFPVWLWVKDPSIRIITNSYASDLATELAVKSRDIIVSEKFKRVFHKIRLRSDKSAKQNYENTKGGTRNTTSTGGAITGKHAHVIINDDPLNPKQASSEADRKNAIAHSTQTLSSRKVDKRNTPTITIMQRLHENDVTGFMLSNKGEMIRHICLPAEVSKDVKPAHLIERYIDGLLDPIRLDHDVIKEAKIDLGSYGYSNQFQQITAPPEGGILKAIWFEVVDWKPEYNSIIWNTAIDPAYTDSTDNDESGMLQFGQLNNECIIRHAEGVYLEFPDLVKYVDTFTSNHGYSQKSMIIVEPKASGKSLVQQKKRDTKINIKEGENPLKDKPARASDISPYCESRRVKLIRGNWNQYFLDQVKTFPNAKQDGIIDCLVMAVNDCRTRKKTSPRIS
ncbi:putative phage terminase large subunit-like protein [Chryseobacterium sp. 52]|uniref:phage terminase large subunit family protein n=1 Tax=Chryseobacterium sp. 52 TaxID=2035213 RepID=UPI000C1A50CF|nr:hypothetical protein [Chryseobacterium sp. 52]PIF44312.1 putative phage terminase large subunit-like protein [Chryseobacterium sp. 52]